MIKCDYHTHTSYCDGNNTAEEMVKAAIEKGMSRLGLSGHCYTSFDQSYCMTEQDTEKYCEEIALLKERYKNRIDLLCGIEFDCLAEFPRGKYDYIIGSAHYIKVEDDYIAVDIGRENLINAATLYFGKDMYALVEEYYKSVRRLSDWKIDIIGHFDLITKFNADNLLFDTNAKRYRNAAIDALDALLPLNIPFEINTGAISRGYRSNPYPAVDILSYIKEKSGKVIFSSDAHSTDNLCYQFDIWYDFFKEKGCLPEIADI